METWAFVLLSVTLIGIAIGCGLLTREVWHESIAAVVFFFAITGAAVGAEAWLTYDFIDDRAGAERCDTGQVAGKYVVPAHTTWVLVGKVLVPIYHPDEPRVQFSIPGWNLDYNVGWSWFNGLDAGMEVRLCYRNGYFRKKPRSLTRLTLLTVER